MKYKKYYWQWAKIGADIICLYSNMFIVKIASKSSGPM